MDVPPLLGLGTLALTSAVILWSSRKRREGFEDSLLKEYLGDSFSRYQTQGAEKYNPVTNLMHPLNNPLLEPNFSEKDLAEKNKQLKDALRPLRGEPSDPSYAIRGGNVADLKLNSESQGTAINAIKMCQAVRDSSCEAFDNPQFADSCGICLEDGKDGQGKPTLGGLYTNPDDREEQAQKAKRLNSRRVHYAPTVGQCKPERFATNKAECQRIKRVIECEKKQNFGVEGCSECLQDSIFRYIDKDVERTYANVYVMGSGELQISKSGTGEKLKVMLSDKPQKLTLNSFEEGQRLTLDVKGGDTGAQRALPEMPNTGVGLAGYLEGATNTGVYRMDIVPMIQVDSVTQKKPRMDGSVRTDTGVFVLMRPGRDKTTMSLTMMNPFTFLNAAEQEAQQCAPSPYVTKEESARLLNSAVCYKDKQEPGKYSQECLQSLFESAGCLPKGKWYPESPPEQRALMMSPSGQPRDLGAIAEYLNLLGQRANTGLDESGKELPINVWNEASLACLGVTVSSPCDKYNKETGPLGEDCLAYLWDNRGETDEVEGSLGPTYGGDKKISSLNAKGGPRYCTREGTMAPLDKAGQKRAGAIAAVQNMGVNAVKAFYDKISREANDNSLDDPQRQVAIQQCYGIKTPSTAGTQGTNQVLALNQTCSPQMIFSQWGAGPRNYGQFIMKQNYVIQFKVTLRGVSPNWTNLFQFTQTNNSCCEKGSRVPGCWIQPGGRGLHVYHALSKPWSHNPNIQLPLNQEMSVKIVVQGTRSEITVNGQTFVENMPEASPEGTATLWAPNPFENNQANADLRDFAFCTFEGNVSLLDNPAGRSKRTQQVYTTDTPECGGPMYELGPLRMGPWTGVSVWAARINQFPQNTPAKWIWNRANAARDAASGTQKIQYIFKNGGKATPATLFAICDNKASLKVNGQDIVLDANAQPFLNMGIQIRSGDNLIKMNVTNEGGPAGIIVACIANDGRTLFVSDATWTTCAPAPPPPPPKATFFEHCNYGGRSITLGPGRYDMDAMVNAGLPNDSLSAIRIPPGLLVTIWEHNFTGGSRRFTTDVPCLVNVGFNDTTSSIVIEQVK